LISVECLDMVGRRINLVDWEAGGRWIGCRDVTAEVGARGALVDGWVVLYVQV
jgi:hypothetical protein